MWLNGKREGNYSRRFTCNKKELNNIATQISESFCQRCSTNLIARMTVLSGGVRSSTDTSHWHPFSSYTSSVPRAVSAARENCQLNTTTSCFKHAAELVS